MAVKTVIGTTKVGRAKFAAAHQTGILPRITHLAFGNGGHDADGNPIAVDDNRTTVPGQFETLRPVSSVTANGMICTIVGRLDYDHEVGQIVSTCGLIDADGDLVAYKNFSPKAKDADTRFEVQWTEQF
jgi:phage-related tail fiber protein